MNKIKNMILDLLLFYPKFQYWFFKNKRYLYILVILWILSFLTGCYMESLKYSEEILENSDLYSNLTEKQLQALIVYLESIIKK